ncbi:MAG TPA: ankyrin repeat domain-containing protein [Myxococcota bacterium]
MNLVALLGFTPLHQASARGDEAAVRALLDGGSEVNAAALDGWTPLLSAAMHGHAHVVALLLARGADAHSETHAGDALLAACASGDLASVQLLAQHVEMSAAHAAQYFVAAHERMRHRVHLLADPHQYDDEFTEFVENERWLIEGPLMLPDHVLAPIRAHVGYVGNADPQHVRVGEVDFERGMRDPNAPPHGSFGDWRERLYSVPLAQHFSGERPLHDDGARDYLMAAASRGDEAVVDALLAQVRPTVAALFMAIASDRAQVVELLLARAPPTSPVHANARNGEGVSALAFAATRAAALAAGVLLDHGASANERDQAGDAPLDCAAGGAGPASAELVLALLERGADASARAGDGNTPLHHAASAGTSLVVHHLLAHKADANARGLRGRAPLHCACAGWNDDEGDHLHVIELLLGAGADLEVRDDVERTPLHYAAETTLAYRLPILERLIVDGADLDARDQDGRTPLDLASSSTMAARVEAAAILSAASARRRP